YQPNTPIISFIPKPNQNKEIKTHLVQEMHQQHLRISFTTITRPTPLRRLPNLHNNQIRHNMSTALVQPRIDLAHIMLLRSLSQTHKAQRLRVEIRISTKNIKHNTRRRPVVPTTNNHTIANDQQKLALII